jgi:hypothetical protein
MQYIPPLVFSSLGLVDPAVTAIISWAAGVEHWPSLFAWFGGAIVMSGVGLISFGEHQRSESAEQSTSTDKKKHSSVNAEVDIELTALKNDALSDECG